MTLTKAIEVARRVMAEHGGLEIEIADMRPRAVPLNPDNPEQAEIALAWNTLAAAARSLENTGY
ncbi:hypothetical protein [Burkholderia vietnamiensis]|uniref:hypothetical protein n=1 Tax=Burkholderia vietnamiensis TaxID=60552 RepID=UPI001CF2EAAB|nr:hypothetical protein [Burkholderia vietnamiensis]MCA7945584.1 hypothetical protein [Burkholderia vietnamiensis]HDR9153799.1 hypothetical protein [Burkholderia vietnamiensis]